jgi:hypothetical protein
MSPRCRSLPFLSSPTIHYAAYSTTLFFPNYEDKKIRRHKIHRYA